MFLQMQKLPEPNKNAEISGYDIELQNVHFSYDEKSEEVLHGIDLSIPEGSFTALVGPSGGGKSTVAKLISRFWDVTDGEIKIGGRNIKDIPLSQLSDMVSFVTQDNFLFRTSLKENIRLGNPQASDEEVYAAAKAAQCDEFIKKLTMGYDTPAGEAGKRLSGGEKQRIAIARMILKNALNIAELSVFIAEALPGEIPVPFQLLQGGGNGIHAIPANVGQPLCGIVPIFRQRQHKGKKPLCL